MTEKGEMTANDRKHRERKLFAEGSYGYRPNRSAKDAILKVKEYAGQGYTYAVVLDLSKYFDTNFMGCSYARIIQTIQKLFLS